MCFKHSLHSQERTYQSSDYALEVYWRELLINYVSLSILIIISHFIYKVYCGGYEARVYTSEEGCINRIYRLTCLDLSQYFHSRDSMIFNVT